MDTKTKRLQEILKNNPLTKENVEEIMGGGVITRENLTIVDENNIPLVHRLIQDEFYADAVSLIEAIEDKRTKNDAYVCLLNAKKEDPGWMMKYVFHNNRITRSYINLQDSEGNTLLHQLIMKCQDREMQHAFDLLRDGADINIKNKQGFTPFQCMLNKETYDKSDWQYHIGDYMGLLNFGADPLSTNAKEPKFDFEMLAKMKNWDVSLVIAEHKKAREKVTLTLSDRTEVHLPDLFRKTNAITTLLAMLNENKLDDKNIEKLGKYSKAKEKIIAYIKNLPEDEKSSMLETALKPGTSLNKFFSTQRGFFATSENRGSFAKLHAIQNGKNCKSAFFTSKPKKDSATSDEAAPSFQVKGNK